MHPLGWLLSQAFAKIPTHSAQSRYSCHGNQEHSVAQTRAEQVSAKGRHPTCQRQHLCWSAARATRFVSLLSSSPSSSLRGFFACLGCYVSRHAEMEADCVLLIKFIWVFSVLTELSEGPAGKSKQDCGWYKTGWIYRPNGKTDPERAVTSTSQYVLLIPTAAEDEMMCCGHHIT